jgi:hypothetical protein
MITPLTITIPAATATGNGVATYSARGKYFLCKATGGEFLVQTNGGQLYDFQNPGEGFGNDASPVFKKLFFYNPGGTAVSVTFYASMTPIRTPDASITSTIDVSADLTNTLAICAAETEGQMQVTWNSGVAVRFAAPGTYFRRAIVIAQKDLDTTANAATVRIGNSASHQSITLAPGNVFEIEADSGGKRDFGSWYVIGITAGDGVSVLYV